MTVGETEETEETTDLATTALVSNRGVILETHHPQILPATSRYPFPCVGSGAYGETCTWMVCCRRTHQLERSEC